MLALALGAALCLVYDLFRIWRLAFPAERLALFFQDVFYWLVCAFAVFCFFIVRCDGEVRYFVFIGAFAGWLTCRFTLSRLFLGLFRPVIGVGKAVFRWLGKRVLAPIRRQLRRFGRFLEQLFKKVALAAIKIVNSGKKHLKGRKEVVYNQENEQETGI